MKLQIETKLNDGLAEAPPFEVDTEEVAKGQPFDDLRLGQIIAEELGHDGVGEVDRSGTTITITVL